MFATSKGNLATEAALYFRLSTDLSNAKKTGDARAIWEARDDLEVFLMYAEAPALKARAQSMLAAA